MRILLIDDEPGVTENLVEYLQDDLHQTEVLNWVDEKGERLQKTLTDFHPEGAILDIDMVPSGFTIYGWLREWEEQISVVFYTKYADSPHHQVRMLEAGADASRIVQKVEAADDVPRLIRALLSRVE